MTNLQSLNNREQGLEQYSTIILKPPKFTFFKITRALAGFTC